MNELRVRPAGDDAAGDRQLAVPLKRAADDLHETVTALRP